MHTRFRPRFRVPLCVSALLVLLTTSAPSFALPILSEIFYDAVGSDRAKVFTEIAGPPGFRLDGWSLVGVNGDTGLPYRTIDLSGAVIPPDGILVVATSRATGALLAVRDFVADVDWQNGPDVVELWTSAGLRADALQYGLTNGPPLGEGTPAVDVEAGLALARRAGLLDTDDNATDFVVADPTPGTVPGRVETVGEPISAAFLALLFGGPLLAARAATAARRLPGRRPRGR